MNIEIAISLDQIVLSLPNPSRSYSFTPSPNSIAFPFDNIQTPINKVVIDFIAPLTPTDFVRKFLTELETKLEYFAKDANQPLQKRTPSLHVTLMSQSSYIPLFLIQH